MTSPPNDPKHYSFVFATSVVKDGRPIEREPFEKEARAFSAWQYNTVRAGPPTPPVYPDQQLNVGPVSFFPYPVRDPNNLPLTFSTLTPLPASLQIDPSTGEIYGNLDALDWDLSTCQVQVSNGTFSVTGPLFRLYAYAAGGVETRAIVYGIEYAVHTFQVSDFGISGQDFYLLNVLRDIPYAEYFLVAGGGGGGTDRGGGGGGGGIRIGDTSFGISSFEVLVGNGGDSYASGYDSSLGSTVAVGGGAGGSSAAAVVSLSYGGGPPSTGGSGGGGSTTGTVPTSISFITGGVASSAPVNWWQGRAGVANQGNFGGNGPNIQSWPSFGYDPNRYGGAGGGGAGGTGSGGGFEISGNGGVGIQLNFTGALTYYAGGGAGGSRYANGAGGLGGGGTPGVSPNGTNGLGGGGAGGTSSVGGRGGSGLVVVRYPLYPEPAGIKQFGLVQWLDAADYTTGEIQWDDRVANYDAAMFNAPVKSADGGGSIQFNGTTNLSTYNTPTEVSPLSSFTIELWARWLSTGTGSATIQTILDNSSTVAAPSFRLQDRPDLGKALVFEYRQTTGTSTLVSGVQVGDDSWHHIAIACDFNAPTVRMYVDGELANSVSSPSAANRIIKPSTTIGRWDGGVSLGTPQYFSGKLAILRSYSRGLSADDVVNNFLNEAARFGVAPANAYGGVVVLSVIDDTAYRVHTFYPSAPDGVTPGTFSVLADIIDADYIIVGGGGGGGASAGGGGGAGGLLTGSRGFSIGSFAADVGAGGVGAASSTTVGNNGFSSTLDGLTAIGGGGGTSRLATVSAASGGSGGGGSGQVSGSVYLGATGTAGQGNNGGNGTGPLDAGTNSAGGGGGGAGATGSAAVSAIAGAGGIGVISSVTGLPAYYAGGGGGGIATNGTPAAGGLGGGGAGSSTAGSDGLVRSGGGGGGGGLTGGRGGSGLIVVRYPTGSVAPVVDPDAANAYIIIPAFGYANSSVASWRDFSSGARTYNPLSAASFDGTGDYLTTPGTANFAFGTGDFTMEGWFYATANNDILFDTRPTSTQGLYPTIYLDGSNRVSFYQSTADRILSPAVQLNTWNHFAVVRKTGLTTLYVNGFPVGFYTDPSNYLVGPVVGIGTSTFTLGASTWAGSLSNFRVTKGVARYEPTYTQPAAAFPDSVAGGDPYFGQVILLLHGDGPNGSTTFTDSSSNALVATRVGNTVISTAQSKWGGSSMLFDGVGDGLSYAANATLFSFGFDDFTIECWFYLAGNSPINGDGNRLGALCVSDVTGTMTGYRLLVLGNASTTGTGLYFDNVVASANFSITFTGTITQGAWHHAAVSRRGTLTRLFLDGSCVAVGTLSNQNITTANPLFVGRGQRTSYTHDLNGYVDDVRVSKVARYTANFVPPQRYNTGGADPNFANTSLLLAMDEPAGTRTFTDTSPNAVAVTTVGDTLTVNPSTGAWTVDNPRGYGGAVYLDGTANSLRTTIPSTFPPYVDGSFTLECWLNAGSSTSTSKGVFVGGDYSKPSGNSLGIWLFGSEIRVNRVVNGTATTIISTTFVTNRWYHIALVRQSGILMLYIDGVAVGGVADATRYYDSTFSLGASRATSGDANLYPLTGYMQDARAYSLAKYTSTDAQFPLNTMLLHFEGSNGSTTFTDSSFSNTALTANGNVQISTARSKWGTASALFDGTGDFLSWAGTTFAASEDWTVECWVFKTAVDASGYTVLFWGSGNTQFSFDNTTAGSVSLVINGTAVIGASGTAVTLNTWHHLAWTRQGTTCRAFVNGVLQGTGTNSASFSLSNIGRYGQTPFGYEMNGNVDELRITKGFCRYTASFTPPTDAFPDRPSFALPKPAMK